MRMRDRICIWLAWRLPRLLVYWCAVRVGAHATTGEYAMTSPTSLSLMDAINRWRDPAVETRHRTRLNLWYNLKERS